jgi:flagellar motor switch protein FliM
MENVLSQQEIDAMVRAARSGGRQTPEVQAQVEPWDLHLAGQIGREQLEAITSLHEGFARNLTNAMGAFLRVVFTAALVSAEYLTYREFLQSVPETTYFASCRLNPMGASAALQFDLKLAFPIIDLLLGGGGGGIAATRDITEIEEQILDSVARIVCRELAGAWQALSLEVVFENRLEAATARRLMSPEEKTLSLSFEVSMPEVRGGLNIAVPATLSHALLRKLAADWGRRRQMAPDVSRQRLMQLLLDCPITAELAATPMRVPMGILAGLIPGQVLAFDRGAQEPASLLIGGVEMFRAFPVRCAETRAARVEEILSGVPLPPSNENPTRKENVR